MSEPWFWATFGDPRQRYDTTSDLMYIKEVVVNGNGQPELCFVKGTPMEEDIPPFPEEARLHMFDDTMLDARNAQVLAVRVKKFIGMTSEIKPSQYYNIAVEFKKLRDEPNFLCLKDNSKQYWTHYYSYLNAMAKEVLENKEWKADPNSRMTALITL